MKHAVVSEGPDSERLGVILEGVGGRLGTDVIYAQSFAELQQREVGIGAGTLDGAGLHVAGDAKITGIGFLAHRLELGDRDVVLLGIARGRNSQPGNSSDEDRAGNDELQRRFMLHNHLSSLARPEQRSVRMPRACFVST